MADDKPQARTPDEIRADIEATREELGDTVEALAHKTDVKARAHDRVEEVKADAKAKADDVKATIQDKLPGGDSGPSDPNAPTPAEQAQAGAQQAVEKAKANPLPLAIAGALVLGYLIGRRRGRTR